MEENKEKKAEKETEKEKVEVAKVEPIRAGDERVHKKRHLLDTCE